MTGRLIWFSLVFLCVGAQSCCRINRLPDAPNRPSRLIFTVQVQEEPTVVFTRHQHLRTHGAPQVDRSYSEFQYVDVLQSFDHQTVAHGLTGGFAPSKPEASWWQIVQDDQQPEAEFLVEVEQYCFYAEDPLAPLEIRWNLRATLTCTKSKEVLWRDCLDWTLPVENVSMDQLGRAEADRRAETLNRVLKLLAIRLADHLTGQ